MGGDITEQESVSSGVTATKPCNQPGCTVNLNASAQCVFVCYFQMFDISLSSMSQCCLAPFCLLAPLMLCVPPRARCVSNLLLFCVFVLPLTRQMAVKSLQQSSLNIFLQRIESKFRAKNNNDVISLFHSSQISIQC